jgi:hypothetical protein
MGPSPVGPPVLAASRLSCRLVFARGQAGWKTGSPARLPAPLERGTGMADHLYAGSPHPSVVQFTNVVRPDETVTVFGRAHFSRQGPFRDTE